MNVSMNYKRIKYLRLLVCILFIIGVVICGVYPVSNQNVKVVIKGYDGNTSVTYTPSEINEMCMIEIPLDNVGQIKEVCFYRSFKSICIEKISSQSLYAYAEVLDDKVIFNNSICDILRKHSKSFLLERIIMAECIGAVSLLLLILVSALYEKLNPNNRSNHGPIYEIQRFVKDMKKYGQYMVYSANADLKAEVANSYLNRLWWLLEPLFNMLVYVIVFGRLMGNSIQNYATFVFSALLMWNFFSKTINYSVKCVRNNRDIVTKVYVPKHVLLISNMFLNFFKLLFSLIVLIPMLIIFKVQVGLAVFWVLSAYLLMIILSFGVGMFFLHYGVYIDDLGYAVGILLQMLMFLSGMFYDVISGLSEPLNMLMITMNPVAMFIDTMRNALLYNTVTNVPLIAIWLVLSLLISYMGIHLVYKNENGYVKVV